MRALIRDLNIQTRNGKPVPGWARRVLPDLAVIADSPLDRADIGTEVETVKGTDWLHMVPVEEAAAAVAKSQTYVRRLAREGRVLAHRVNGKAWVVDLDSLRSVADNAA
ncbi:hypothetical protein [Pimelobacter simplex]|uniref:hypothetical protein n=1 Tax=Nocardioides simplex TaxID=2045 RepID=UPI001931CA07|nr:hypothetical protein [Pimelobacter simplex]